MTCIVGPIGQDSSEAASAGVATSRSYTPGTEWCRRLGVAVVAEPSEYVRARSVVRVIIAGEWIWVEPGTFTVQPFVFVDDAGNILNESNEPAYHFVSTNKDPYFGPLSAIQLIKVLPPERDALGDDRDSGTGQELPAANETTEGTGPPQPEPEPGESGQKKKVSADDLFKDPLPMSAGDSSEDRRGGLL